MTPTNCHGLGRILGHKFRPRCSYGVPQMAQFGEVHSTSMGIQRVAETMREITYHYDICERCGKVIKEYRK